MEGLIRVFRVLNNAIEFIEQKGLQEEFIDFLPENLKGKVKEVIMK